MDHVAGNCTSTKADITAFQQRAIYQDMGYPVRWQNLPDSHFTLQNLTACAWYIWRCPSCFKGCLDYIQV